MGLLTCGKRQYFYDSKRVNGKVVNKLVASGLEAEYRSKLSRFQRGLKADEAAEARERRADRREQRQRQKEYERVMTEEEVPLIQLAAWTASVAELSLVQAGYRKRRGEWRRPRAAMMTAMMNEIETSEMKAKEVEKELAGVFIGREPMIDVKNVDGEVTAEVVEYKPDDPENQCRRVALHFQKCLEFDTSQLPAVRRTFDAFSQESAELAALAKTDDSKPKRTFLNSMIEGYGGNPAIRAEEALIRRLATGRGLYCQEATERHLVQYKADLLGDNPSPIERALVDSIACCYLDVMETELRSAKATSSGPRMLDFLERRKERATRRYHRALKALDLIRRKAVPAIAVQIVNNANATQTTSGSSENLDLSKVQ